MPSRDPTLNPEQADTAAAVALHAALAAVDMTTVPVMCLDRSAPRLEQAALARTLFRQLGLRGIRVTTPRHSMACQVDVILPKRSDHTVFELPGYIDFANDPAARANGDAAKRVSAILLAAFPRHDDEGDKRFKWLVF